MFYANIWDPALILSQIALLQSIFYILVGIWLFFFSITFGTPLSLHALLAPTQVEIAQSSGWPIMAAFILAAPILGYVLLLVVGRAKQCLDFTATLYFIHLCICSIYHGGIPTNWEWWGVNIPACILCVVLGEYLCLQKELESIPMTSDERDARERRAEKQNALNAAAAAANGGAASSSASERMSLVEEEKELRGERTVRTTTIRLTPNNVFNAGWPTMSLFAGLSFIALGIYYGRQRGGDDWRGSGSMLPGSFIILNVINAIIGVFLIFGPGEPAPKSNVIGLQMLIQCAIGFYVVYTNLKAVAQALFVATLVNVFSIVGCFPLLSHESGIFATTEYACNSYFNVNSVDRCKDTGYLQLIRTFSLFGLFFLTIQSAQLFLAFTEGTQLGTPSNNNKYVSEPRAPLMTGFGSEQSYVAPSASYEGTAAQQQALPQSYSNAPVASDDSSAGFHH